MRNTIPIMDLNNPDELIRANGAAEAARTDRLREEVSDYTQVIEQLRDLYDRNNELVQKLQFMNRSQTDEIRRLLQENNDRISEKLSAMQDWDTQALRERISAAVSGSQETVLSALQKTQDHATMLQQQSEPEPSEKAAAICLSAHPEPCLSPAGISTIPATTPFTPLLMPTAAGT